MATCIKGEKQKRRGDWFLLAFSIIILLASVAFFIHTSYPSLFESDIELEKKESVSLNEPIVLNFSRPVISGQMGWSLNIFPQLEAGFRWENNNKKLIITPKEYWLPENEYKIHISGVNYFLSQIDSNLYFKTVDYPKVAEFYPASGQKDVLLDIEDPIRAVFDSPIKDFDIKFTVDPFKDLDYQEDYEKNQINLMPKGELERGKKYTIEIYAKYRKEKDEEYKKIGEIFFETKPAAPQEWNKNFSTRLEEARKFTEAKVKTGKYIDINLKSQVMSIFEDGEVLDTYMVSSGKRGMETPQGSFTIANKTPRAWSKKYGLFMPYWMAIVRSGDFGIHELPEWPGGYKEGQNHLGTPVSHGCVRLGVGPAQRVYNFADVGTPVIIYH